MAIYKNKDLEVDISFGTSKQTNKSASFYTGDKGSASIRITVKHKGFPFNFAESDMIPTLDLIHSDGSIWLSEPMTVVDGGTIQYNIPNNIIEHAGTISAKLFLKNADTSIHALNFNIEILDSGIEGVVEKEVSLALVEDIVINIMQENALGILDDEYKESLFEDVKGYLLSNESFRGQDGQDGKEQTNCISVEDYGAVGDGEYDNKIVFQNAINDMLNTGKYLYIPSTEKGYYLSGFVNIEDTDNIRIESNGANIIGKGFYFSNVNNIYVTGINFESSGNSIYVEDSLKLYNCNNIYINNNTFDSTFLRLRNYKTLDIDNLEKQNVWILNNEFKGDVSYTEDASSSNIIEIYGYRNVYIKNNIFNTYNTYRVIKLGAALTTENNSEISYIKDEFIVDNLYIVDNIFNGSIKNKQAIDCFSGVNHVSVVNNIFKILNASRIFENKIASDSGQYKVLSTTDIKILNNTVEIQDNNMVSVFSCSSFKGSPLDTDNRKTNLIIESNYVTSLVDTETSFSDIAGFNTVTLSKNSINLTNSNNFYYVNSIHSCEVVNHNNNYYEYGSIQVFPTKSTSDSSVNFDMSLKVINSSENTYRFITGYGGIVIRNHTDIKSIKINNEYMAGSKSINQNLLSSIYLRDLVCENVSLTSNSLSYDEENVNRIISIFNTITNYNEYQNSWNPSMSYSARSNAIPITGMYKRGDRIIYTNPIASGYLGVICTQGGSPGVWKEYGQIL